MSSKTPNIQPYKEKTYNLKQPRYSVISKLPTRAVISAPSGSGKTVLLQNMILDIYKGCFERIYIISPSIHVDNSWIPVKKYIEKDLKLFESDDEQFYFDEFDPIALQSIIDTQHKIIKYQKQNNYTNLYQILIILDDVTDNAKIVRYSKLLNSLYCRGRHAGVSVITSTQKLNALNPIIRVNMTELYLFRQRNQKDIEVFLEELSAICSKQTLMKVYNLATKEDHSFLYCKLTEGDKNNTFMVNYDKYITIN